MRSILSTSLKSWVIASLGIASLFIWLSTTGVVPTVAAPPDPSPVSAIEPEGHFDCRWTSATITIDGSSDEPAWQGAQVIDRFTLPWLADNPSPKSATRARLLWDREYLYFLADMDDADLFARIKEHDGTVWEDDAFEMFLKPSKDKPAYYEFNFNPANVRMDLLIPSRAPKSWDNFRSEGEFEIKTAVRLRGTLNQHDNRDEGWTIEGRIAWRSLFRTGGRPEPGDAWSFALCRVNVTQDRKTEELSTAAPLKANGKPNFHKHEEYATLTFVGPRSPKQGGAVPDRLPPLTTSRVIGSPEPPPPFRAERAYPKLALTNPIAIDRQPGTDKLLALVHNWDSDPCRLLRFADNADVSEAETVIKFDSIAYDLAFHPKFAENGYVYVGMNGGKPQKTSVVRYRMDPRPPHAIDPASATTIIEWESAGHNGGAIDFGPDGMLYISSGDGSNDSDEWLSGQDLSRLLAKVLRIDVDHPDPGRNYAIPKDNPFVGVEGVRPETWAYGFRNPWRLEFDRKTGHLWVTQNGQDHTEQTYLVERSANYGWSATEGSKPFYPDRHRGGPIKPPTAEHPHSEARSLTGGIVYHGDKHPLLAGAYIYGDYSTGKIWGIRHDGQRVLWHQEIADTNLAITGFGTNAAGDLLVLDHRSKGAIYRLEPTPKVQKPTTFPTRLSESGLFKSVKGHVMQDGILPYSVNAELWSDGAHKERFIAIPHKAGEDRRITYTEKRGMDFPDETVLVKSFALEDKAGDPASRRWIETRFLTKQQGEWVGYSYRWNEEQTDATLVGAAGADHEFTIADPNAAGGSRAQKWHYPSRAECMVCHSRAANFVLGTSLHQLNKDHDYGDGQVENQLAVLERLGMLKANWETDAKNALRNDARERGLGGGKLDEYVKTQTASKGDKPRSDSHLLAKPPARLPKLVDPYDATASLDARARSYLHANCAICHIEAGGGNAAMELEFTRTPDTMRLFDEKPLHHAFGVADARVIAPGAPERSLLLHRMTIRGQGQMPPLATHVVDERAVDLMRRWIAGMPATTQPAGGK